MRVNSSGVFDLGDHGDYIGPLTLEGGQVTTSDTGLIWLFGSVTVISNNLKQASIDGQAGLYYATVTFPTQAIFLAGSGDQRQGAQQRHRH